MVNSHAYGGGSVETAFRSSYPSTEHNVGMRSSQGLASVDENTEKVMVSASRQQTTTMFDPIPTTSDAAGAQTAVEERKQSFGL